MRLKLIETGQTVEAYVSTVEEDKKRSVISDWWIFKSEGPKKCIASRRLPLSLLNYRVHDATPRELRQLLSFGFSVDAEGRITWREEKT